MTINYKIISTQPSHICDIDPLFKRYYPGFDTIFPMINYWAGIGQSFELIPIDISHKFPVPIPVDLGVAPELKVYGDIHGDLELTLKYLLGSGKFKFHSTQAVTWFDTESQCVVTDPLTMCKKDIQALRYVIIPNLELIPDSDPAEMIFVGDYCDRGSESKELLALLLHAKTLLAQNDRANEMTLLFGDHDCHAFTLLSLKEKDKSTIQFDCPKSEPKYVNSAVVLRYYRTHASDDSFEILFRRGLIQGIAKDTGHNIINSFNALRRMLRYGILNRDITVAAVRGKTIFSHSTIPEVTLALLTGASLEEKIAQLNEQLYQLVHNPTEETTRAIITLINHTSGARYRRIWPVEESTPPGFLHVIGHDHSTHSDQLPRPIGNRIVCVDTDSSYVYTHSSQDRHIVLRPTDGIACYGLQPLE